MVQLMLTIQQSKPSHPKTTPNLLPCRVNYDGPVEPSQAYWSPIQNEDGTKTAYFRGRKLAGKSVKLPEGYRGVVVEKQGPSKNDIPPATEGEDEEEQVPLGSLETKAEFEEVVVWGHETTEDSGNDPYARVDEWIGLTESIHSFEKGN